MTERQTAKVTLFETFELVVDGALVDLPIGAQRLVAFLAVRGRTGRSRLAGQLWPDTSERRALGCLRTGIWRINQTACGLIHSSHGGVELGLSPAVDVQEFLTRARAILDWEQCCRIDEHPSRVHAAHAPRLAATARPAAELDELVLPEGELLPDWDDEWLAEERERLHQLRLHVLEATAQMFTRMGSYGLALEAGLAALRADALRESAHRTVISIHVAEGNLAEAQRAYEHCSRTMREELGIEPAPSTRSLLGVQERR